MIRRAAATALLDAVATSGRGLGMTSAALAVAAGHARAGQRPVTFVVAERRSLSHVLATYHALTGREALRSGDLRLVAATEPELLQGAACVVVDHHALQRALGDSLERERLLMIKVDELEAELRKRS